MAGEAGAGDNFHVASVLDVKPMLRAGMNVLAVAAENGGDAPNPAGLIGTLVVKFRDGHVLTVPTDKSWQSAQAVQGKWTTDSDRHGGLERRRWNWARWAWRRGEPSRSQPRSLRCTAISAS